VSHCSQAIKPGTSCMVSSPKVNFKSFRKSDTSRAFPEIRTYGETAPHRAGIFTARTRGAVRDRENLFTQTLPVP
jgi:hypothetical protein